MKRHNKKVLLSYIALFYFLSPISAQDMQTPNLSQNVYGGIGLIQTPTARFSNDGEFAFGMSIERNCIRLPKFVPFVFIRKILTI